MSSVATGSQAGAHDVVVVGSGGGGLMAALAAAVGGLRVAVLERSPLLGGTTAISGGGLWVPCHPLSSNAAGADSPEAALAYLDRLTLGAVARDLLEQFVAMGPDMVRFLLKQTELRLFCVERPDYHPDWAGARWARSLEPLPYDASGLQDFLPNIRLSTTRGPVTSKEARLGLDAAVIEERRSGNVRTQGAALVAGLVEACRDHGVEFILNCRVTELSFREDVCVGVACDDGARFAAQQAVVLASGGFEWNADLVKAYLPVATVVATTPPANEGDGLIMALKAGAAVDNMAEAWWTAAVQIPDEAFEGQVLSRNVVRELALPGSILINRLGQRFVNEACSYNDLGKAFFAFDIGAWRYPNLDAWMVFDDSFRRRYPVAGRPAGSLPPTWFHASASLAELADKLGVSSENLSVTVATFNGDAVAGIDQQFGRGADAHNQYYADQSYEGANGCLGPLATAPFYAVRIVAGSNGTKGGLVTDAAGRVQDHHGRSIAGLYACGNVAASIMGPGYPGHGGSLGPILTAGFQCGLAIADTAAGVKR